MIYKTMAVWLVIQVPLGLLVGLMIRRGSATNHEDEESVPEMPVMTESPRISLSSTSDM